MPGAKSLPRPARRLSAPTGPDRADRVTHNIDIGTDGASRAVPIDIQELLATRLLVQGNSGSGKSHLLRRLLEQSAGLVQQVVVDPEGDFVTLRSEEHTSELQSLMRISYAVFCLKKKKNNN